jgi:hypothetical protein
MNFKAIVDFICVGFFRKLTNIKKTKSLVETLPSKTIEIQLKNK